MCAAREDARREPAGAAPEASGAGAELNMVLTRAIIAAAFAALAATPAFADALTLRARVEASGPAITLGDVFDGAGDTAARAIAPAPSAGQTTSLPVPFLIAAAESAGHTWTPPAGVAQVRVIRPGGARATLAPSQTSSSGAQPAETAVRRNEVVQLIYAAPGLTLTARGRALGNGGVGDAIRVVNLQSNRTIEATVTGPGAAAVNGP